MLRCTYQKWSLCSWTQLLFALCRRKGRGFSSVTGIASFKEIQDGRTEICERQCSVIVENVGSEVRFEFESQLPYLLVVSF